jgi:hypothetical protein
MVRYYRQQDPGLELKYLLAILPDFSFGAPQNLSSFPSPFFILYKKYAFQGYCQTLCLKQRQASKETRKYTALFYLRSTK